MARISENYDSHTKDELLSEVEARGIEGVSASSRKDDIIAALALDDETGDPSPERGPELHEPFEPAQPPAPLPPLKASPIPKVNPIPEIFDPMTTAPKDEDFTDGVFKRKSDGEQYALCIHEADQYGKTHSCKNSLHFWQGDEKQFDAEFSKK